MNWLQCLLLLGFGLSWASTLPSTAPTTEPVSTSNPTEKPELNWPDECKKGPQYWCQNARSAKECGALPHCLQTVWIHQSLLSSVDDSSACKTCVDYVTGFKNVTGSNVTIKQLEIVLDATCQIIPQYLVIKECMLAVKVVMPELQKLITEIDPHTLCSMVFICDAATLSQDYLKAKKIPISIPVESKPVKKESSTTDLAPSTVEPKKKLECSNCYTLVTTGQKLFRRASRDDVLNRMLKMCGELSSFSDICSANVITYFPTIYHKLETLTVGDACHLTGVCDSLYHFHDSNIDLQSAIDKAPENANDEVCDFCLAMVDHLRDIVISNSTELEFKQVLEGICKQTGNFKDQCLQLVDQYYELIYQFFINELDAKELCEEVKLCVPKGAPIVEKDIPLWPIVPSTIDLDEALKNETTPLTRITLSRNMENSKPLALVGADRCTWGPAYWCTNMTTSKECSGSLKHCIHEVWEKMELPADNGDICNICKDMVKQARDQLNSNETQEELREVFEGSCKLIPIKIARKECIAAVDEFVPELVETLSSQMNPQIVCATVGLCNSARLDLLLQQEKLEKSTTKDEHFEQMAPLPVDRMLPQLLTNLPQSKEIEERGKEACEVCELMLHFVQQQMTLPKSEAEIKQVVHNVCVKLPHNVATQCSSFIDIYGDAFIALLAQEIDPSVVCPRIGACSSYFGLIDNVKPTCPLCLLALEALHNKLGDNKTEAAIVKALDTLCKDLPHNMVGECEHMVKKSADEIVDAVIADFSPQETCLYLKFCDASVAKSEDNSVETIAPPLLIPRIEIDIATNNVNAPNSISGIELTDNTCVLCEFIVSKLDSELKNKKTAEEIKHTVYTICDHLPSNIRKQCDSFVNQYADMVIELLAYSLEPEKVCAELHLCHSPKNSLKSKESECLVCEALIGTLQGLASDTHAVQIFRHELYKACEKFPKNFQEACFNFVSQLAPQIEEISRSIPPSFICSHLKVCNKYLNHVDILNSEGCSDGPEFWCASTVNAASCGTSAIEYCQENMWKGPKPKKNPVFFRRMLIAPLN